MRLIGTPPLCAPQGWDNDETGRNVTVDLESSDHEVMRDERTKRGIDNIDIRECFHIHAGLTQQFVSNFAFMFCGDYLPSQGTRNSVRKRLKTNLALHWCSAPIEQLIMLFDDPE